MEIANWRLAVDGAVEHPLELDWEAFLALPQAEDVSDIHCVTQWSRYDNRWQGVKTGVLAGLVKPKPEAELKAAKSPGKASKGKAKPASKAAKANEEADVLVAEADKADEENKPRRKANTVPKVPKKK